MTTLNGELPESLEDCCPRCGSVAITATGLGIQDGPGAPITEELPWLTGRDLELVMGRAVCDWLGWKR